MRSADYFDYAVAAQQRDIAAAPRIDGQRSITEAPTTKGTRPTEAGRPETNGSARILFMDTPAGAGERVLINGQARKAVRGK